jgi:2-(3-amino-3-carboxypropyl)histidine synthase
MFETGRIIPKLKGAGARRVFLQVPEGLKTRVQEFARELEEAGMTVFVSVEPCFGGCDLRDREAKSLGCDALVHVGHSDYGVKPVLPVIYEEYGVDFDPVPLLRRNLRELKGFRSIGLVTTVQYLSGLAKASSFLRKQGKKIVLGSPSRGGHPGQVLGCDFSAAKSVEKAADCFVFLGTGSFHPLGLAMEVDRPVLFLDFESGELVDLAQEKFSLQKMRYARIAKASQARNFGIIVSTKPGQSHPRLAEKVKGKLESLGRKAWVLVADQITPEKLLGLKIEALVNTACPRLAEDSRQFRKPIISPGDIELFTE